MNKEVRIILCLLLFVVTLPPHVSSANLDNLYEPFLEKNSLLYSSDFYYFGMKEDGEHGTTAYKKIEADPVLYSFNNSFRFSLADSLEIGLGYRHTFPADYRRSFYTHGGALGAVYDYELDYFQGYNFNFRTRHDPFELYLDFSEKRQKGEWDFDAYFPTSTYQAKIRSNFENLKGGLRYLSPIEDNRSESNLSKIKGPLLSSGQMNLEAELGYRSGKLKRSAVQQAGGLTYYPYVYHFLRPHLIPKLNLRYGLSDALEIKTGLFTVSPYKYKYRYRLYSGGFSWFAIGTYKLRNNFYVPFALKYRPDDNLEILFSSHYHTINQTLDYWQKDALDVTTFSPPRELTYHNVKPTIKLSYLHHRGIEVVTDKFLNLAKNLLRKTQWLFELQYQKDITHLNKNVNNGTQNIIDPYRLFLSPSDSFISGTEYSAAFAGNNSSFATGISPQNDHRLQASFAYGITDNLNAAFKVGYQSGSTLHHFTVGPYSSRERFFKFRPHYFFDLSADWHVTKNSLFTLKTHFVPRYITYMDYQNDPQRYKSENKYFEIALALKVLF